MRTLWGVFGFFRRKRTPKSPKATKPQQAEWLVVGLGNPGEKYATTRHNVGFMVVDALPDIDRAAVIKPQTFMNLSGEAVAPLAKKLGVPTERIIVIHDELDLPVGKVRVKRGGNENGHNGLKSLTEHLGTRDYLRVRVGIARPPAGVSVPDWVLSPIHEDVSDQIALSAKAVQLIISEGLEKAQNVIHATK